jgi:hypothetical protein
MYQVWSSLQCILTKLVTYLVLKRIWNPIDFQGQRSRSPGQIFRRGDAPRFALPLLILFHKWKGNIFRLWIFKFMESCGENLVTLTFDLNQ